MSSLTIPQSASATNLAPQTPRAAMITSDFDTFLRMLTTQIQNQDPLNPMQSTEFATQLATFSGVEQQVRTNEQLAGLSAQLGLSSLAHMSNWIGMLARSPTPVQYDGVSVTAWLQPPAMADSAQLIVLDSAGREVQRRTVTALAGQMEWTGLGDDGTPLPAGRYRLQLESFADGKSLGLTEVEHFARVAEARGDGAGGVMLVFANGATAPATAVTALRRDGF